MLVVAKRRSGRSRLQFGKASRRTKDLSDHTLMMMIILVLVISVLSTAMYVYAFYGEGYVTPKYKETKMVLVEKQTSSGTASIQIIKPPEGSK